VDKYFDFESLPIKARKNLRKLSNKVIGVNPIETGSFCISTLDMNSSIVPMAILEKLSNHIQKHSIYIYYIQVLNNPDLEQVKRSFSTAKEREKTLRFYPRFNCKSEFLYVGSSSNLTQRCKEHFVRTPVRRSRSSGG